MADIELPNGGKAPLWATEETMKSLLNAVKGSSAFGGKKASSGNSPDDLDKAQEDATKKTKEFADGIFKLSKPNSGILAKFSSDAQTISKNFSTGLGPGIASAATGLGLAADAAGKFAPAVQVASFFLGKYAELLGQYLDVLPQAIDTGLGFSNSLGKSAKIVDQAGISVKDFYSALKETGSTYRALGDNAYDAARNFGELQSNIRGTFGTFGQSNKDVAESSAAYVKLMAQTGLRGSSAVDSAASAYGNSMEQMRKISIATGTSLSKLQGSMKELMANPVVIAGMNKLGKSTEDAAIKMAKASAGFESVFGDLGRDLYKQIAEAEAAGLSIINTQLGAELAPFTDLGALTKFNKMLTEGGGTATEMAEAQRQFLASTEANLPTLLLLKQQGNKAAGQMLELYNKAKSAVIMSQDELDAQELKKRGEERLLNIQNKISAAYEKVQAKLFGFIAAIPEPVFEALGAVIEGLTDGIGFAIDAIQEFGPAAVATWAAIMLPSAVAAATSFAATTVASIAASGGLLATASAAIALATPILAAVAPVVLLGAAIYAVIKYWDDIPVFMDKLWENVKEGFNAGVAALWEAMTAPFVALSDWFKSSWLGKKIFGDSGSASETASAPIMDSTPSNTAKSVQDATAAVAVAKAETTRATADKSSEHLERLARIAQESAEQQAVIAKNTGNTVDAVANSTASY